MPAGGSTQGRAAGMVEPEVSLPIENYDCLSLDEIIAEFDSLTADEIEKFFLYEAKHKDRLLDLIMRLVEEFDGQHDKGHGVAQASSLVPSQRLPEAKFLNGYGKR